MINRLNNYLLNSVRVAIMGFLWLILFKFPWETLPNAPLVGKLIAAVALWSVWSFMVMIASGEVGNGR